jgi:hypothetical protein
MKLPWAKFYPGDWLSDEQLSLCSPEARGIYMDFIAHMMKSGIGEVSGTLEMLARLARCKPAQVQNAICEFSVTRNAIVIGKFENETSVVTVISRRLKREEKARKQTRKRVLKYRRNGHVTPTVTPEKRESNGVEARGQSTETRERETRASDSDYPPEPIIPTVADVVTYCSTGVGIPADFCQHYHEEKTIRNSWTNARGVLVQWRIEIVKWWAKDRATWGQKKGSNANDRSNNRQSFNRGSYNDPNDYK